MILTYSNPRFKDLILLGQKIHTIREDKNRRWKPGMSIQHWMGNPRNVLKNPHQFASGECKAVQDFYVQSNRLDFRGYRIEPQVEVWIGEFSPKGAIYDEGRWITYDEVKELAKNDGLTLDEFREWFVPDNKPRFTGRIIHFTDKTY